MTHFLPRTWLALAAAVVLAAGSTFAADNPPQTQLINEELAKAWKAAELKPSKKTTDFEFVRRVFIDVVGRIPTAEEVKDFAEADSSANKRTKLVHRLLYDNNYKPRIAERVNPKDPKTAVTYDYASEYARHFADMWGVWLMTRGGVNEVYHEQLELWLEDQFAKNTPWSEMVKQLLTAKGKSNDNGAVAFIMAHVGEAVPPQNPREKNPTPEAFPYGKFDAVPITSRVTRLFLGVQTNCIQCHDHPFNPEWKQDNFWGVNAFFRQLEREGTPAPRDQVRQKKANVALAIGLKDNPELNKGTRIFFERRSGIMHAQKPNFLPNLAELEKDGSMPKRPVEAGKNRRDALADYVVGHDNFAKAYVNRMWAHFFGRGMNELPAADDFGGHNKVVHPDLLNKLAADFANYGYDTKKLIEWICNSDAYQLSYQANGLPDGKGGNAKEDAAPYFTRMQLKAMSPEVLFESLEVATRLDMAVDKAAKKDKKTQWMNKLTQNFGDDEGNEVTFNGTIIQALLMMNGQELNSEISRTDGTSAVDKAMAKHRGNEMAVINELYLMALARRPSSQGTIYTPVRDPKTGKDRVDAKGKPMVTGPISEQSFLTSQVTATRNRGANNQQWKQFFEDVYWSLLNTNEFMLNH